MATMASRIYSQGHKVQKAIKLYQTWELQHTISPNPFPAPLPPLFLLLSTPHQHFCMQDRRRHHHYHHGIRCRHHLRPHSLMKYINVIHNVNSSYLLGDSPRIPNPLPRKSSKTHTKCEKCINSPSPQICDSLVPPEHRV